MRTCPFCGEEMKADTMTCEHCGGMPDAPGPGSGEEKMKWYFRKPFIIVAVLSVGPLALPLIWWRPQTSLAWKIGLTVAILALSWLLFQATMESIRSLKEYSTFIEAPK